MKDLDRSMDFVVERDIERHELRLCVSVLALSLCLGLQQRQAAVRGTVVVSPRSSEPRWTPDQVY